MSTSSGKLPAGKFYVKHRRYPLLDQVSDSDEERYNKSEHHHITGRHNDQSQYYSGDQQYQVKQQQYGEYRHLDVFPDSALPAAKLTYTGVQVNSRCK